MSKSRYMQDSPPTPDTLDTYSVEVVSHGGARYGIYGGLTPSQWSLQDVVSGIDWCFTGRVFKHKVGISESTGLRKDTKEQDWMNIKNWRFWTKSKPCGRLTNPTKQHSFSPVSPNYSLCQFPFCDVGCRSPCLNNKRWKSFRDNFSYGSISFFYLQKWRLFKQQRICM